VNAEGWQMMEGSSDELRAGYALARILIELSHVKPNLRALTLLRAEGLLRASGAL